MRFGSFVAKYRIRHSEISYNLLTPKPDPTGEKSQTGKINVTPAKAFALLVPYCSVRFKEQLRAVVPLAVYLALFQIFVLQYPIQAATLLLIGLLAVVIGLAIFMEWAESPIRHLAM